jgi:hypothetical protein
MNWLIQPTISDPVLIVLDAFEEAMNTDTEEYFFHSISSWIKKGQFVVAKHMPVAYMSVWKAGRRV